MKTSEALRRKLSKTGASSQKIPDSKVIIEGDQGALLGAQQKDKSVKQHNIIARKVTSDSMRSMHTPNESARFINQNEPKQRSLINLFPGISVQNNTLSPFNFGVSDISQPHKLSAGTFATLNQNQNHPQSKSTAYQTPLTQPFQIHRDSTKIQSLYGADEEEEEKIAKQSSNIESKWMHHSPISSLEEHDIQQESQGGGVVTLHFQKHSAHQQSHSLQFLSKKLLSNQEQSSVLVGQAGSSQVGLMNSALAESQESPHHEKVQDSRTPSKLKDHNDLDEISLEQKDSQKQRKLSRASVNSNNIMSSPNQRKSKFNHTQIGIQLVRSSNSGAFEFIKNMNVMKHVNLFMSKLRSFTIHSNLKILTEYHYKVIGDLSAFFIPSENITASVQSYTRNQDKRKSILLSSENEDKFSKKNSKSLKIPKWKKFGKMAMKYFDKIPVFDPNSFILIIWDIIMMLVQIAICLLVPIEVSFQIEWNTIDSQLLFTIFFAIDVFLSLNRGIYMSGISVIQRKNILKEYFKKILFTDIVTVISLLNISEYLSLLILIRISYIMIIVDRLDDHFQIRMKLAILSQLTFMVNRIILIAHFCACGLFLVSRLSSQTGNFNEFLVPSFEKSEWGNNYINCLYLTLITMSTVGYGDITPKNNIEKCYVMVMTMLSSAIFGYILNTISQIFSEMANRSAIFQQKKFDIVDYMNNRQIPKFMQMKTIKYLEYSQMSQSKSHLKGESILESLPSQLSSEIKLEFYGKLLLQSKLFSTTFSVPAIHKMALSMKEISLARGQFLFQPGSRDFRIYFLLNGILSVSVKGSHGQIVKIAGIEEKNSMIGQHSFFCEQMHSKYIKCEKSSNLAYIDLQDFKNSLSHFPIDFEIFCQMRDMMVFEGKSADTPCVSCNKYTHNFSNCPLIHLKLNKIKIIHSKLHSTPQERQNTKEHTRSKKKKILHSLLDNQHIRTRLRTIRIDKIKEQWMFQKEQMGSQSDDTTFQNFNLDDEFLLFENFKSIENDKKFFQGIPEIVYESDSEESQVQGDPVNLNISIDEDEDDLDKDDDEIEEEEDEDSMSNSISGKLYLGENLPPEGNNNDKFNQQIIQLEQIENLPIPRNPTSILNYLERNSVSSSNIKSGSSSKTDQINHFQNVIVKPSHLSFNHQILEDNSSNEIKKSLMPATFTFNSGVKDDSSAAYFQLPRTRTNSQSSIQSSQKDRSQVSVKRRPSQQSLIPFTSQLNPQLQQQQQQQQQIITQLSQPQPSFKDIAFPSNGTHSNSQYSNDQILKIINMALRTPTQQQMTSNYNSLMINQPNFNLGQGASQTNSIGSHRHRKSIYKFLKNAYSLTEGKKKTGFEKQKTIKENNHFHTLTDHAADSAKKPKQQELFFYDFEEQKKMVKYFPRYNMTNVVLHYNKILKLRIAIARKNRQDKLSICTSAGNQSPEKTPMRIQMSPLRKRKDKQQTISTFQFAGKLMSAGKE